MTVGWALLRMRVGGLSLLERYDCLKAEVEALAGKVVKSGNLHGLVHNR